MTEFPPVPDDAEITPPDADGYVWAHWTAEDGVRHMVNLTVREEA